MDRSTSGPNPTSPLAPAAPQTLLELLVDCPTTLDDLGRHLETSPARFLDIASRFVEVIPLATAHLATEVSLTTARPIRALAAAASYLQRGLTVDVVGIDLPRWLVDLDESDISQVRWRGSPRCEEWLVEAVLPGGRRLAAHLLTEPGMGALNGAVVTDGTIRTLERAVAGEPFVDTDPYLAAECLVHALGRYRATIGDPAPDSCWPGNEALVTWMIATLLGHAQSREVAA